MFHHLIGRFMRRFIIDSAFDATVSTELAVSYLDHLDTFRKA